MSLSSIIKTSSDLEMEGFKIIIVDAVVGDVNLYLPDAIYAGQIFKVMRIDNTSYQVKICPILGQKINGIDYYSIYPGEHEDVVSCEENWFA